MSHCMAQGMCCMAVGGSELPVVIVMVVNSSWLYKVRPERET